MFGNFKQWPEKYYAFWLRFMQVNKKAHLLPVNFHGPWTTIIWQQRSFLAVSLFCECIIQTFYALYPYFIARIIESGALSNFGYLMLFWLGIICLEYVSVYFSALLEIQSINSVQYSAFQFFLTVDPIYHMMKASGKLFAKIERCARSYEDFLDIVLWDILPVIVSIVAVVTTFFFTHKLLGLVALLLLLLIAFINIFLNLLTSATFERRLIEADDAVKVVSVESLTQVQLIRSSFATQEIAALSKDKNREMMVKEGTAWLAFASAISISRLTYLLSVCILGYIILYNISQGYVSVMGGTALILTYLNGTYEIIQIGRRIRKLIKAITRIKDLYTFIQKFGKQTFPVLGTQEEYSKLPDYISTQSHAAQSNEHISARESISITAAGLHFDYNPKAKIFEEHNLFLEVPINQPNKLYGIIGPSGMGKTTLLSLLGGQLRPDQGLVAINDIPIYFVDDNTRRKLIAIQGQIASNLSGTVRRNLLLGIPQNHAYSDEYIITILQEVGIWNIFDAKEGLATPIGEAGLTLSGGQRQRLNFAGLYLRAQYFKPAIILIDEPTSSLDEVSERAITQMISQLAQNALTLVIAHRLKTLENAVGILDFSLLDGEKNSVFYTRQELEKRSVYYRKLMQGDISIGG